MKHACGLAFLLIVFSFSTHNRNNLFVFLNKTFAFVKLQPKIPEFVL